MTAILGFNYMDGVLMMSDTEETTSYATKSECGKLYRFIFPIGTVITGGSGDTHLIECANQELHQFFASGGGQTPDASATPEDLLAALNDFAQSFFANTTGQYAGFAENLVPTFEMLIAVNHNQRSLLFRWTHNRVVWIPRWRHTSIGAGSMLTHPMLRDFEFPASKESTLFIGLRMMYHAKRTVQGVGGKTEAFALQHDGKTLDIGLDATRKIEELVINLEQFINRFVYLDISNVAPGVAELEENVAKNFSELPGILHQYRERFKTLLAQQLHPKSEKDGG